jgi:hypothetical protein
MTIKKMGRNLEKVMKEYEANKAKTPTPKKEEKKEEKK